MKTTFPRTNQYFIVEYNDNPDHLFSNAIFRCKASDNNTVIGECVCGHPIAGGRNHTFVRSSCTFKTVSSAVAKAVTKRQSCLL